MSIENLHSLDFFQIISENGITFFQIISSKFKFSLDIDLVGMIISAIQAFSHDVFKSEVREIILKSQIIQFKKFEYKNNLNVVFHFIAVLGYPITKRNLTDYSFQIQDSIVLDILDKIHNLHLLDNYEDTNSFEYDEISRQIEPILNQFVN
jgi:hypothetical protein